MTSKISVVMPTYNGERFLAEALDSLTGPGGPDEVIVVDDGSTDATLDIARLYRHELDLLILEPGRQGSWAAMTNVGISVARYPWVSILHQDDKWLPGRRGALAPYLSEDIDLVVMDAEFLDETGRALGPWRIPGTVRRRAEHFPAALFVQNWIAVPAATFRTEAALDAGGLDEDLWYTPDWDLWLKLSKRALPACAPGPGAAFRIHRQSQTVAGAGDLRAQLETVQARHLWAADTARTRRAGALSTETNILLGAGLKGQARPGTWFRAAVPAVVTGAAWRYWRDSAIADRLGSRLRAGLRPGGRPGAL